MENILTKASELGISPELVMKVYNFFRNFNYIALYKYFSENRWLDLGFTKIPTFLFLLIGLFLISWIARKIRAIAFLVIIVATIAFIGSANILISGV